MPLQLHLDPTTISLGVGESKNLTATVTNTEQQLVEVELRILGPDGTPNPLWAEVSLREFRLNAPKTSSGSADNPFAPTARAGVAAEQAQNVRRVSVTLKNMQASPLEPGEYTLTVQAINRTTGAHSDEEKITLQVQQAVVQEGPVNYELTLSPPLQYVKRKGAGTFNVQIYNRDHLHTARFQMELDIKNQEELSGQFATEVLSVPPGEKVKVELEMYPAFRPMFGEIKNYTFTVRARQVNSALDPIVNTRYDSEKKLGTVSYRPVMSMGYAKLARGFLIICGIILAVYLFFNMGYGRPIKKFFSNMFQQPTNFPSNPSGNVVTGGGSPTNNTSGGQSGGGGANQVGGQSGCGANQVGGQGGGGANQGGGQGGYNPNNPPYGGGYQFPPSGGQPPYNPNQNPGYPPIQQNPPVKKPKPPVVAGNKQNPAKPSAKISWRIFPLDDNGKPMGNKIISEGSGTNPTIKMPALKVGEKIRIQLWADKDAYWRILMKDKNGYFSEFTELYINRGGKIVQYNPDRDKYKKDDGPFVDYECTPDDVGGEMALIVAVDTDRPPKNPIQ